MKNLLLIVGMVCLCLFGNAQEIARGLTASNGQFIGFYEYKPTNYTTTKKYPLIIFLHGIGERGNGTSDLYLVNNNCIPRYIAGGSTMTFTNPNTGIAETFLVLCPQLDMQYGDWQNFYVDEMLKYAKANLSVDQNRIFLCGISLGGGGVWKYATNSLANAQQFAGIIPCCGTGEGTYFCNIADAKTAVWAFHAMDDPTVGVGNTQYAQIVLGQCPNLTVQPKFTYYPTGGHGIWDMAFDQGHGYQNPNVYEWMLGLSRANLGGVTPVAPANVPPVANAGAAQAISLPASSVTLNGTGSTDADGTITGYSWTQVSGPSASAITSPSAATTTVTGLIAGTYVFQLAVTDNLGATSTANVTVAVSAASIVNTNQAPVANAGNNFSTTNNYAYLSGGASYDPDGSIATWAWSQVSGPNTASILSGNTMFPTVQNLVGGTYVFQLTVTDNLGASASSTVSLTVGTDKPPVASAGGNFNVQLPQGTVTLDGSLSYDPDGTITSYAWTKVSGPAGGTIVTPAANTTQLTGLIAGTYVYQLAVTDNGGLTATAQVTVTVLAATTNNKPPYCNAGNNFTSANNYVYLSGGASYDPDGQIVNWAWTEVSGPNTASVLAGNTMFPTVQGLIAGTYVFNLVVTDNMGATASSQVSFTITSSVTGAAITSATNVVVPDASAATTTSSLSLSPNPAQSFVNLVVNNATTGKMKVLIFDATGKAQKTIEYSKAQFDFRQQIDVTGLSQGVYYMQIVLDGKSLPTQKFVKL